MNWLQAGLSDNEEYICNIGLYKCSEPAEKPPVTPNVEATPPTTASPPFLRSVLGEDLYSSIADWFSAEHVDLSSKTSVHTPADPEPCILVHSYNLKILPDTITNAVCVLFVLIFCALLLVFWLVRRRSKKQLSRKTIRVTLGQKETDHLVENSDGTDANSAVVETLAPVVSGSKSPPDNIAEGNLNGEPSAPCAPYVYKGVQLLYQSSCYKAPTVTTVQSLDIAEFINNTSERLFAKLDKLLLKGSPAEHASTMQLSMATPRLARRSLHRRQRVGSSPTLPNVDAISEPPDSTNSERDRAWKVFKKFSMVLAIKEPIYPMVDGSKFDRKVQRLLHYYQRVCPIEPDHWAAAALVTEYSLFLIMSELIGMVTNSGHRFVDLVPIGSLRDGTKVGKPNQFDFLMVIQPPVNPIYVLEEDKKGDIPPGKILINVESDKISGKMAAVHEIVKEMKIDNKSRLCLSSKEFSKAADELVEVCLQNLYTRSRSLMDRLPFQIKRALLPDVTISIDTKSLVGLGLPELKLRIIPALPLPIDGWFQAVQLYATPPAVLYEYKHKPNTRRSIHPDYLWNVHTAEYRVSFMAGVESKMKHACVDSCHRLCLLILKSLLTGSNKNNLLDRGVFHTTHVLNALSFLLLESVPVQWTMDKLGDRFSDLIHFLREAYQNGRLPDFFINNPHVTGKIPAVVNNPVLMRKKQYNVLSDMKTENLEKCLQYLDDCLKESGLQECVKGDYSEDMWEYEFFLFN